MGKAQWRLFRLSNIIVGLVLLALMLDGLDLQLLSMVGPKVIEEWRLPTATFSQALASAVVGLAFGAGLGGWLGDYVGHRRVALFAMVGCAAVTAATALADSITNLAALRFFTGVMIGAVSASAIVFVTQSLGDRGRVLVTTLASACVAAGGMLGSVIVLAIEPSFGWRGCFVVAGAAMLVTPTVLMLLPRPKPVVSPSALKPTATEQDGKREALFVRANLRMNIGAPLAAVALSFLTFSFAWTPVILTKTGLPLSEAVLGYLAYNVMALLTPLAAGPAIHWFGTRRVLLLAAVVGAGVAATMGAAIVSYQAEPSLIAKATIFGGIGAIGAVCAMIGISLNSAVLCGYSDGCRGRGVGFGMMAGRFGGLAAIVGGGFLLDSSFGPSSIFFISAVGLLVVAACGLIIDRHVAPLRKTPVRQTAALGPLESPDFSN